MSDDLDRLPTARFRRQHMELFELSEHLLKAADVTAIREQPQLVRTLLARFVGKLRIHAAMENDALYPRLLKHTDPAVRALAQRLLVEVGPIYDLVFGYAEQWQSSPDAMINAPEEFVRQTRQVMKALGKRVMQETGE